jgi:GH15 family glucan-1,4-alpha-glucosidase
MAQYYIMTGEISKAEKIIEAPLNFSNDLGYFAEEGDIKSGEMLGNFPQTFVHASFIGAIIDLNKAKENN